MYAEPPFYSKDGREQIVERLFESFSSPAVFLAKNPVLASFALGRQTSLVVDIGYDATIGARPPATQSHIIPRIPRNIPPAPFSLRSRSCHRQMLGDIACCPSPPASSRLHPICNWRARHVRIQRGCRIPGATLTSHDSHFILHTRNTRRNVDRQRDADAGWHTSHACMSTMRPNASRTPCSVGSERGLLHQQLRHALPDRRPPPQRRPPSLPRRQGHLHQAVVHVPYGRSRCHVRRGHRQPHRMGVGPPPG